MRRKTKFGRDFRRANLPLLVLVVAGCLSRPGWTQTDAAQTAQAAPAVPSADTSNGEQWGQYLIHQSVEFGGRVTELTGSNPMYNTLVSLQSGPRLLQQTLSFQSRTHAGNLFDSLYLSSFGWGGDPSNAARLRMSKVGWYNFNATFQRDQNYFDYDLFANPLNPPSVPNEPVNFSPHAYYTTRRMYDFALVLRPQHRLSFRLEYNRNRSNGPSFGTFHEGTEPLLNQLWNTTLDAYRFGADLKVLPRTTVSFTEILQATKIDTDYNLAPFNVFPLANGTPVSLGLPWQPSAGNPCAAPFAAPGVASPTCNLYISYTRNQRVRNFMPTEQLNLQSTSIRRLDLVGRVSYSTADMTTPETDLFNGLVTRTTERGFQTTGAVTGRWVSVVTEFGATLRLTDRLRLVDSFRFNNWRVPATLTDTILYLYNASTVRSPGSALQPVATFPPTTLLHTASSSPDIVNNTLSRFLKQDMKSNQAELQWDFAGSAGARLGYRYRHRTYADSEASAIVDTFFPLFPAGTACAGHAITSACVVNVPPSADEGELDTFDFGEHTGLAGLWYRPSEKFRANFDLEFTSAGGFITRISPRHQQQYRLQLNANPHPWLSLGANFNILERNNHTGTINFDGHSRNWGANAMIAPNGRFGLDLAYNYTDFVQNDNVCYTGNPALAGNVVGFCGAGLFQTNGFYDSTTNYGSVALRVKPVTRVQMSLGYSLINNDGNVLILDAQQPFGILQSNYQQPLANVAVNLGKGLTWNTGWNYYQYGEGGATGPTFPRYFHSNIVTLSLTYAF